MTMRAPSALVLALVLAPGACLRVSPRPNLYLRPSPSLLRCGAADAEPYLTCDEVLAIAEKAWGLTISESQLGPSYQVVARTLPAPGDEDGKGSIVAYTTGFLTGDLLRQDTMQIYGVNRGYGRVAMETAPPAEAVGEEENAPTAAGESTRRRWRNQSPHGLSLLLGYYAMRRAYDRGCAKAELLAINDDPRQHKILLRHYQRMCFRPVRDVGEGLASVPDRLVWGGVGTLMEADITENLRQGSGELRRAVAAKAEA
uniref:Uncharacterized protein n=1 Tax=Phaeomonas parva TaxID=124430 RepID=A0A7S1TYT8_9STRA|mmetsp:Transcript_21204/g.64582  ORF Transcript_21204/g.64582 Transcript_21204/m.64582 type:complete len:257 (+) Transcript_21204:137-907(+)